MDKNHKTYIAPQTEVIKMQVEQVLAASGGPYPTFEDELDF